MKKADGGAPNTMTTDMRGMLSVIGVLLVVATLAGCGGGGDATDTGTAGPDVKSETGMGGAAVKGDTSTQPRAATESKPEKLSLDEALDITVPLAREALEIVKGIKSKEDAEKAVPKLTAIFKTFDEVDKKTAHILEKVFEEEAGERLGVDLDEEFNAEMFRIMSIPGVQETMMALGPWRGGGPAQTPTPVQWHWISQSEALGNKLGVDLELQRSLEIPGGGANIIFKVQGALPPDALDRLSAFITEQPGGEATISSFGAGGAGFVQGSMTLGGTATEVTMRLHPPDRLFIFAGF